MNLEKLHWALDWDKTYLLSSESDMKYLMWQSYIKWVEILYRDKVINILADILIIDTVRQSTSSKYPLFDSRSKPAMEEAFSWIDELYVDADSVTLSKRDELIWYWVLNVIWEKGLLKNLRLYKTDEEITILKEAQDINMKAFIEVTKLIRVWMSELEIANLIKIKHLEFGASGESFEPIVAFNEDWANPHHINSPTRLLRDDDQVLIDMWCIYKNYCSDMTRVLFMDKVPEEQKQLYELVRNTTYECLSFIKIWMTYKEVYDKAKKLLWEHSELFIHSLSHWIWIDVHEIPLGSRWFDMKIEEWHVFSIEPWIYFPWKYGFRYEIMAVVKDNWAIKL